LNAQNLLLVTSIQYPQIQSMNNRLLILAPLLLYSQLLLAKPISSSRALDIAFQHLQEQPFSENSQLQLHADFDTEPTRKKEDLCVFDSNQFLGENREDPLFHLVADKTGGFAIVAGDDRITQILGISPDGFIDPNNLSGGLKYWLLNYSEQIEAIVKTDAERKPMAIAEPSNFVASVSTTNLIPDSIEPLIETHWGRTSLYIGMCPVDSDTGSISLPGPGAVALAQILKYWEYPKTGRGSSQFQHEDYGLIKADYGSTTYEWGQMPNELYSAISESRINEVANLLFQCAASIETDFSENGGGLLSNLAPFIKSLQRYFNYGKTVRVVKRENTSNSMWISSLKQEIQNGRPVIYYGSLEDRGYGWIWVCDGYDSEGRIHFNWGEEGAGDGYFVVDDLADQTEFFLTRDQGAIIGIAPQQFCNKDAGLKLTSPLTVQATNTQNSRSRSASCDIQNNSDQPFSGKIAAGIYTASNQLIHVIGTEQIEQILPDQSYSPSLTYDPSETENLLVGDFFVTMIYQLQGSEEWLKFSDEDYENWAEVTLEGVGNELVLQTAFEIGDDHYIYQNTPFDISFQILNTGSTQFNGRIKVGIYTLDGERLTYAGTLFPLEINHLAPNTIFETTNPLSVPEGINLRPGEYLAAILFKSANSADWQLVNGNQFSNPTRVVLEEGPDIYENSGNSTYTINLTDSDFGNDNIATYKTQNASIQGHDDTDRFRLNFQDGWNYSVEPRVHDAHNSDNGILYSADVRFLVNGSSYKIYDDLMDRPYELPNDYYQNSLSVSVFSPTAGTYQFEFNVRRKPQGQIDYNDPKHYLTPLFRIHRPSNHSYFFTANETEKNSILSNNSPDVAAYEGASHRVLHTQTSDAVPVYRLYNRVSQSHFYTASESELTAIETNLADTFSVEGVAFFALSAPLYNAKPVYRFFLPETGSHFFTISKSERDQIMTTLPESMLKYEGIAWYAYYPEKEGNSKF